MNAKTTPAKSHPAAPSGNMAHAIQPVLSWLFPSITDLIFVVLLLSMSYGIFASRLLGDGDIGWHIRNGQLMLRTHSITRTDPFSAAMQGKLWYAWEWLYDLMIAAVHNWAGLNGVVWITALLVAFTFALTFRLTLQRGAGLLSTLIFLLLTFAASSIHMFARPHVFTWLFGVIWFVVLDSAETSALANGKPAFRHLLWLPLIMLFWANLHGGFLLGFILLGIYLLSGAVQYAGKAEHRVEIKKWLQQLGAATLLSVLAGLVNPFGYKLYAHIYAYLTDRWLMDHIDEFQSPNFHGAAQQCFVGLILLTFITLAAAKIKPRLSQWLVILFAVYSGFYAARNLPTASLLLTLIVAPLLSKCFSKGAENAGLPVQTRGLFQRIEAFSRRMEAFEWRLNGHLWPAAAIIIGFLACSQGGKLAGCQLMNAQFSSRHFPVQAAGFIAQSDIPGPIFCPDSWGGYLIYRLYPKTLVYVDDRHDLYGSGFFKNYVKIVQVTPDWQAELHKTRVHWVLLSKGSSLANILEETTDWKVTYEDHTSVLFEERQPDIPSK